MTSLSSSSVDESRTRCVHMPPPASNRRAGSMPLRLSPISSRPPGAGTDGAELLRATQAHVGLLRRQLDVSAETSRDLDDLIMERTQRSLRTGIHRVDQFVAAACGRATLRGQGDEVCVPVAEPVLRLQPRHDLAMPLRAAGLDQCHPFVDRPAGGLLDVARLAASCVVEGRHRCVSSCVAGSSQRFGADGRAPRLNLASRSATRRPTKPAMPQRRRSAGRGFGCRRTPSSCFWRLRSRRWLRTRSSFTMTANR